MARRERPDGSRVGRVVWWPVAVSLIAAAVAAVTHHSDTAQVVAIVMFNAALIGGISMVVARLIRGHVSRRSVVVGVALAVVYHAVAFALPRPDTGMIRIGVGDLMLLPGAVPVGEINDVVGAWRRDGLAQPSRAIAAVSGTTDDRFVLLQGQHHESAWYLAGYLEHRRDGRVYFLLRVAEDGAVEAARLPDDVVPGGTLREGAYHDLQHDRIVSVTPGERRVTELEPEAQEWLVMADHHDAHLTDDGWFVGRATHDGSSVGWVGHDGGLRQRTPIADSYLSVERLASADALYVQGLDVRTRVGFVFRDGKLDDEASERLTDLFGASKYPSMLAAAPERLWFLANHAERDHHVLIAHPSGQRTVIPIRFPTAIDASDDAIFVAALDGLFLVRGEETTRLASDRVVHEAFHAAGNEVFAALRDRETKRVRLVRWTGESLRQMHPDLRLFGRR